MSLDKQGQPWDEEEELELKINFGQGTSLPRLVELHGRTTAAILTRLVKLHLIVEVPALRSYFRVGELVFSYGAAFGKPVLEERRPIAKKLTIKSKVAVPKDPDIPF